MYSNKYDLYKFANKLRQAQSQRKEAMLTNNGMGMRLEQNLDDMTLYSSRMETEVMYQINREDD